MKANAGKKAKKKKEGGGGDQAFERYLKREHSKVWHLEKKYCLKELGMEEAEAKKNASKKGREKIAELRKAYAEGKLVVPSLDDP